MQIARTFENTKFPFKLVSDSAMKFGSADALSVSLELPGQRIQYDSLVEAAADYRGDCRTMHLYAGNPALSEARLEVYFSHDPALYGPSTTVTVKGASRQEIETVLQRFEDAAEAAYLAPPQSTAKKRRPTVFIGHGRSPLWRDVKDHVSELHGYRVEAYETGARAGHQIRDILQSMVKASSFAILIMTGEDEQPSGEVRARQNVVHEVGLFQGSLGFDRAVVLFEEGTEEFSNLHGIQQIRFAKGNIRETFGDVLATLRREFGAER